MKRNQKNNLKLTEKQEKVLPFLLASPSIAEAARQSGVCTAKTLHEWFREAAFREEVTKQRDEIFFEALDTLKTASQKAVKTLIDLLESDQERTKLAAAKEILAFAFKGKETLELEKKIDLLLEIADEKS